MDLFWSAPYYFNDFFKQDMTQLDDLKRDRKVLDEAIWNAQLSGAPKKYYQHIIDLRDKITDTINNIR